MTLSDTLAAVQAGAMVIATIYAALTFHRLARQKPPARAATPNRRGADPVPQPINTKRSVAIIAGLVILSWLAAIADFADRHWISGLELSEAPLGPQNARIDLQPVPVWKTEEKRFFMNFRQINNGKTNALDTTHVGGSAIAPGPMDKDLIDAFFIVLRTKLRNVPVIHNEYVVGQSNSFFTIPDNPSGLQFDDNGMAAAQKGALPIFIFAVLKYRDDLIPKEKSIYTEKCVYLLASVVHFCETGHNQSYIAN